MFKNIYGHILNQHIGINIKILFWFVLQCRFVDLCYACMFPVRRHEMLFSILIPSWGISPRSGQAIKCVFRVPQCQHGRLALVRKKEIWLRERGKGALPQPEEETNHCRKLRYGIPIIVSISASLSLFHTFRNCFQTTRPT
jgi:hypothetical protein